MPDTENSLKTGPAPSGKFDVDAALDNAAFSKLTLWVIFIIAAAVILEAVNNNLLGIAIPKLMEDWQKPREYFKYAVTFSMIGMMAGAFISGFFADKFGRRAVILATLPICGAATMLIGACATNITDLAILRFIVSFGFGGLLPVAASMTAEFAPKRWRTLAVSVPLICVALGTIFAGFLFNAAHSFGGWPCAFYIGGFLPLILCAVLLFALPESPLFMAQNKRKWAKLSRLLRRLGHQVEENAVFADAQDEEARKRQTSGIKALFKNGLARDTLAVWTISFFGIAALYAIYMWLPAMLGADGVSGEDARKATAYWFSCGGIIGAVLCAWCVSRFGSRKVMIIFAAGAALCIGALLFFDIKQHILLMSVLLGLHGLFNNGVQVPLYAIFAHLYPTRIRATGASMASSAGKLGTIFAGFLGGLLSVHGYFIMLALFMLLVLAALLAFRRHIPANG